MEPRQLLAANPLPIQVGTVYYEDASGVDEVGDLLEVTFSGGAPGTQMTQLVIETDKLGDGLTIGDVFFDTASSGVGAYGSFPFEILEQTGIDSVVTLVADGSTTLTFTFAGFEAGDRLRFTLDIDEGGFLGPNAVAEGNEFEGSILTATFTAPHYEAVTGSDLFYDHYDPKLAASGLDLPPDNFIPPGTEAKPVRTAAAIFPIGQTPLPISIAGTVFEDFNTNNEQDPTDPGIAGVQLSLLRLEGPSYLPTGRTTQTDASGNYRFDDVLPGTYRIVETQPDEFLSVGASAGTVGGVVRGMVVDSDVIGEVELSGGDRSIDNDFAEVGPATITGRVVHDVNADCKYDPGDTFISGVTIHLLDAYGDIVATATTNSEGKYEFTGLLPGIYGLEELQPEGYMDACEHVGTAGGTKLPPNSIIDIDLKSGMTATDYNFAEVLAASLSGYVYVDKNNDGMRNGGEAPLPGVTLTLLDKGGNPTDQTTTTDTNGYYVFDNLRPGRTYGVVETHPDDYLDGLDSAGTAGGTAQNPGDRITGAKLGGGMHAKNYNFGELPPVKLSGYVYVDENNNGTRNVSEAPIAAVRLILLDSNGNQTSTTTTTDATGYYEFNNLIPGRTYGVAEAHPSDYLDGLDSAGTAGGAAQNPGDKITGVQLMGGVHGKNYNFGELIPASLSGYVYVDENNDGARGSDETPIAGVKLNLLDAQGKPTGRIATTNASGFYQFNNLVPGHVYGVAEVHPTDYLDGLDIAGTAAGAAVNPGDRITGAQITNGMHAENYNFGELAPGSLSGYVYVDKDNNGTRDMGEIPIANVELKLLDAAGKPTGRTTTTDAAGYYQFDRLWASGTYGVAEVHPTGYLDGLDSEGTAGGTAKNPGDHITQVKLATAAHSKHNNFGELLPGSIAGRVYTDSIENGLVGVTINLFDAFDTQVASTTTDAKGEYLFANLAPGEYTVAEVQPPSYFDSFDTVGSVGGKLDGNDRIAQIIIPSGTAGVEYNFREIIPASISGYVFQDGPVIQLGFGETPPKPSTVRDGAFTPDDTPIAGVVLTLGDGSGVPVLDASGQTITTVTDANGRYEFNNLRPGAYTVLEGHPEGYTDSMDTPGTHGGRVVEPDKPVPAWFPAAVPVEQADDTISFITLGSGDTGEWYNFSEVLIEEAQPIPFLPRQRVETPPLAPVVQAPIFNPVTPVAHYVPAPERQVLVPLYGGGGFAAGGAYSWHLSVVNGGRPRRDDNGQERIADMRGTHFNSASWTETDMARSQWILTNSEGQAAQHLQFGPIGGTPLAGDFNGDGITEIAIFLDGLWFLDLNGNGIWDEGDLWAQLGKVGDQPVTGDWDGDGKDDIGIYGPAWTGDPRAVAVEPGLPDAENAPDGRFKNLPPSKTNTMAVGLRTMKRTVQGNLRADVIDHVFRFGTEKDVAISGDFNGDGVTNVGLFREGTWYLDVDGTGRWSEGDEYVEHLGVAGDLPVVGDFNGDGVDQLGVYRRGVWHLDSNNDRVLTAHDKVFQLGGPHDKPVVGDFNGDGVDEIAIYRDGVSSSDSQASHPMPTSATPSVASHPGSGSATSQ